MQSDHHISCKHYEILCNDTKIQNYPHAEDQHINRKKSIGLDAS